MVPNNTNEGAYLQNFLETKIRPNKDEVRALRSDINRIYAVGINNSRIKNKISRIFKGGSFGRKTYIKGNYEGDYVFILKDEITNIQYNSIRDELLVKLKENFPKYSVQKMKYALRLKYKNRELDILLAKNASDPNQVASKFNSGLEVYMASNGIFQEELYKEYLTIYPQLRDRILLAKYWLQTKKNKLSKGEYPPSYGVECMVMKHSDLVSNQNLNQVKWFRAFLEWLGSSKVTNPINFRKSSFSSKISKSGINITDPGNPSMNVVEKWTSRTKLQQIAKNDTNVPLDRIFNSR